MDKYSGYLSGRISNDKNYKKKFDDAFKYCKLIFYSWYVFNPADTVLDTRGLSKKQIWQKYMKYDIPILCTCDIIFMMPWWILSSGARFEWWNARKLGLKIVYLKSKDVREVNNYLNS